MPVFNGPRLPALGKKTFFSRIVPLTSIFRFKLQLLKSSIQAFFSTVNSQHKSNLSRLCLYHLWTSSVHRPHPPDLLSTFFHLFICVWRSYWSPPWQRTYTQKNLTAIQLSTPFLFKQCRPKTPNAASPLSLHPPSNCPTRSNSTGPAACPPAAYPRSVFLFHRHSTLYVYESHHPTLAPSWLSSKRTVVLVHTG